MAPTDRRSLLRLLSGLFIHSLFPKAFAEVTGKLAGDRPFGPAGSGNFKAIYSDSRLRGEFLLFLKNVFHLYPEDRFHALIGEITTRQTSDRDAYAEILRRLPEIKPLLGKVTYALPALSQQREEMAKQTAQLLAGVSSVNGYVEVGTPGRYVHTIGERIPLKGRVFLVHDHQPGYGLDDVVERGGIRKVGEYVALNNYSAWPQNQLQDSSVDLVTNFIGLHHSPPERLDGFVKSIHRVLRPGGRFILRDHDAQSPEMLAMVGLAHDVYNAGLGIEWSANEAEIRHFKSLREIESYLAGQGFERKGDPLYQAGDPTKNALMMFVKRA